MNIYLACVLVVATIVRIAALVTIGDLPELHGDEAYYVDKARVLLARGVYPGAFRPPGQSAFLAGAFALFGDSLAVARVAQIAASLLTVAIVFDLGARHFGKNAGLAGGLLCAGHPTIVSYTHFIWSETLYGALLMVTIWCLDRWRTRQNTTWVFGGGIALGCSALTRETGLYFLPIALAWLVLTTPRPRRLRGAAAALTVGTLMVVAPWIVRTYAALDVAAISTNRWRVLALGNASDAEIRAMRAEARELRSDRSVRREELARDVALEAIRSQQPAWLFRKARHATVRLLAGRSQLARYVKRRWFPSSIQESARRLVTVELVVNAGFMVISILGLWLTPAGNLKGLVLLMIAFHWAIYVVTFANPRFAVPLLPPLAIYGGALLSGATGWRRHAVSVRVCAAASAVLYLAILICATR